MIEAGVLTMIQQQTQTVTDFLQQNGVQNDYGAEALKWLEAYIDRRLGDLTTEQKNSLIMMMGAFLGECLRQAYGGEWIGIGEEGKKQLGVQMDVSLTVMPFYKVVKYVADPEFNSFSYLFTTTKAVLSYIREKRAAASGDQPRYPDGDVTASYMRLIDEKYAFAIKRDVKIVEKLLRDSNVTNDYGSAALGWLENLMENNRQEALAQNLRWFFEGVGAFLGECLCRTYDGVWIEHEHGLGIQMLDGKLVSFPFSKVTKFIQEGSGDSFVMMFALIPLMKEEALKGPGKFKLTPASDRDNEANE